MVLKALIAMLLFAPVLIYDGYILTFLWQWFVADVFQLNPLRVVDAIGLSCVVAWLHQGLARARYTEEDTVYLRMIIAAVEVTFLFGLAAVVHAFQ